MFLFLCLGAADYLCDFLGNGSLPYTVILYGQVVQDCIGIVAGGLHRHHPGVLLAAEGLHQGAEYEPAAALYNRLHGKHLPGLPPVPVLLVLVYPCKAAAAVIHAEHPSVLGPGHPLIRPAPVQMSCEAGIAVVQKCICFLQAVERGVSLQGLLHRKDAALHGPLVTELFQPVQSMKDCSVVTANYDLGGGLRGTIGIIGPKRMDYEKVLGTLRNLMNQLDTAFKKDER